MRRSTQKMAPLFIVLLAALLAFPSLLSLHRSGVSAYVPDTSRSDVKPRVKPLPKHSPRVVTGAAPANDNCANAIAITSCPFTDTKDTTGASNEAGEPASTCTTQSNSVWYSYTNTTANPVSFNVDTCGSDFDTALMVWKVNGGPCVFASFTAVACSDDFGGCGDGFQSSAGFTADPGASYKIQVGGFAGETGNLTFNAACQEILCDPVVITGTLSSGDSNFTGTQFSGMQLGRLNRNGVASSCAAPKTCLLFTNTGLRAFDAYEIHNDSGEDQCVSIDLNVTDQSGCNLQSNAYLESFDPNNICGTTYLGDPGLSSGTPPTPTNFSVVVPANKTLIVVVHTVDPGTGVGCHYTVTVSGNLCAGFDACIQDDRNPARFLLINTTSGKYEYHDCSKNIVLAGTGVVSPAGPPPNCKFFLNDSGPIPKRPDRSVHAEINVCTLAANATIRFPLTAKTAAVLTDSNYTNNNCVCP
jgi:hypothetical protein